MVSRWKLTVVAALTISNVDSFSLVQPPWRVSTRSVDRSSVKRFAEDSDKWFFATSTVATPTSPTKSAKDTKSESENPQSRVLGSQELLMLPRQYGPNEKVVFPQMNHVSCSVLSATPSEEDLQKAVQDVLDAHPLLQSHVEGDGEPERRIDLFKMVRSGEPNPLTFVEGTVSVADVLKTVNVHGQASRESLDVSWKSSFARDLDNGAWCDVKAGPLWKLEWHRFSSGGTPSDDPCALLLSFNHAISDQSSANRLADQILQNLAGLESKGSFTKTAKQAMPLALEDSVLGEQNRWNDIQTGGVSVDTVSYVASKAAEEFRGPVLLPDSDANGGSSGGVLGALEIISGRAAGGEDTQSKGRKSVLQFRTLSKETTDALLKACRANGVSITNALTAAVTLTASDFVDGGANKREKRTYKVLESLDMRRFGEQLDKGETVACMAGSMDLMHGPISDRSGEKLRKNPSKRRLQAFWDLAKEGQAQTNDFIGKDRPREAVRVWDFAMSIADMTNLVYMKSQSNDDKGRAFSAGITNVGVYEKQLAFQRQDQSKRDYLKPAHGRFQVEDVFFATPHTQTGCLYQVSCQSLNGQLRLTFNPVEPMVDEEANRQFSEAFVELLNVVSGTSDAVEATNEISFELPENILTTTAAIVGLAAVLTHVPAWASFFESVAQMKANADPVDFSAALNFWIFFAFGHPILQPILWISDVLHASPGPMVAGLVPLTFLAGNAVVIAAISMSKDLRNAVNVAALAAFFAYVGAGLEGAAGLGDFNLALDDSYKGQIVRGCPAYEDVRQPSMDNFDLKKYQGLWYEQKFHDWTQFKEVYDTTLGIKLTEDGKGWIDDFAVKGPAPDAAPKSWDKSPVANGAHYFLFGRVDEKDPPGVLRESGFGVEFPNYIVDVKKDSQTGEYVEAIQFQCLERGGVRVFEGINFMSRNPVMTEAEMTDMHARAEKAGMYPYGASPDQMHTVAQRPQGAPAIDNNWQQMWKAIGLDRLLELLTESIEDGGR